jgi:hypothetical protein
LFPVSAWISGLEHRSIVAIGTPVRGYSSVGRVLFMDEVGGSPGDIDSISYLALASR